MATIPGRRTLSFVAVLLALAVGACAGSGTTPADGMAIDPAVLATGRDLYAGACAECHGSDLRGTEKGPSHLSVVYEPAHHGDTSFYSAVRLGSRAHHWPYGDMPPVEGLTDEDIGAIVAFVRETQRTQGFEPYPP